MRWASGTGKRIASWEGPEELLGLAVFREGLLRQEAPSSRYTTPLEEIGTLEVTGGGTFIFSQVYSIRILPDG